MDRHHNGVYAALDQALGDPESSYRKGLLDRLAIARPDLEYWLLVRAQQITDGLATNDSRVNVKTGDLVRIRGHWRKVERANFNTVSVETDYSWTDKARWREVQDHRAADAGGGWLTCGFTTQAGHPGAFPTRSQFGHVRVVTGIGARA